MKKRLPIVFVSFLLAGCANGLMISEQSITPSNTFDIESSFSSENTRPPKKVINAPLIKQLPELPRGCEVTSLAMLLQFAGIDVDKMTLAKQVKKDSTPFQRRNGRVHFGNPNTGFVGDMYSLKTPGLGVYVKPIEQLAEQYLPNRIVNMTGSDFDAVYQSVANDKPVWVVTNTTYAWLPERFWQTWDTPNGQIKITYKEHSVLVTGYDEQYVYFNDPLRGIKNQKAPKESFIKAWEQMGSQALTFTD